MGRRKNALDHLDTAYENGYNPFTLGCYVVIGDGIKGTDEVPVPVAGQYVKEAKIGQAIMDADIVISMNHFKGHVAAGFGGALKNLGMGCGSRAGKMEMHSAGKPVVEEDICVGCGVCRKNCAHDAIVIENKKASFDPVALDMACVDAVNAQKPVRYSKLGEAELNLGDHFRSIHPATNGIAAIEHGVKIGLGSKEYELIQI